MLENPAAPLIGEVPVQDRSQALALAFSYLPSEQRYRQVGEPLAHASSLNGSPFEGLIGAYRHGRLVGAIFSQIETDKTAFFWLPRLTAGEPESTTAQLFDAAWAYLLRHRIVLAKTLLPVDGPPDESLLRIGGMHHVADLLYLVSQERRRSSCNDEQGNLFDLATYNEADHERLVRVIQATYAGSLDCPALAGEQSTDNVLAGYRSIGVFSPRHWRIVRHGNRDVGCLLLADHPRRNRMELLYLGLIPEVRGRGWGKQLAGLAKQSARAIGRRRLVLAVDAANRPAVQTYMAMDFQTWQRRRLYIKRLAVIDNWHASFQQVIHVPKNA